MDATEPELFGDDAKTAPTVLGPGLRWFNAYSLMTTRGVYEGQRSETDRKRVCILTRSGFSGQQRYATAVWSGDVSATWEVFRRQIPAGLNFCMAGMPWWTTDIGGFFTMDGIHDGFIAEYHGGCRNEEYRELYTRWFQFGAWSPVFRSHGTNTPREPWQFGEPGTKYYDSQLKFTNLRYRLLPYLYSLSWKVTSDDGTMMRGLAMDFPEDRKVHGIADQYLFGKEFLVAPVTVPLYTRGDGGGEIVPRKYLSGAEKAGPGLHAEFFSDKNFGRKVAVRDEVDAVLDCRRNPPPKCPRDRFSIRWTGALLPPESGLYEFTVSTDDDIRVLLNGRMMVERKAKQGSPHTFRAALRKGKPVPLVIELSRSAWSSMMKFKWRKPSELAWKSPDKSRRVYLPAGASWIDFWTGKKFQGGTAVKASSAIDEMPLFVRSGSIVPMGPEQQHVDEKTGYPIELRIYPGADAVFDLYEDEGDGYGYERGLFSLIRLEWLDKARELVIHPRKGGYPGMPEIKDFRIIVVGPDRGGGSAESGVQDAVVRYKGSSLTVRIPPGNMS
jgi:alpha-D-xyloside xylohydrolase